MTSADVAPGKRIGAVVSTTPAATLVNAMNPRRVTPFMLPLRRDPPATTVVSPIPLAQDLVPKAPPDAIELTAQDYAEIEQLAVRYAWLIDRCVNGGYDYADLYVPEGQFSVAESFGTTSDEQRRFVTRGREALARAAGGDGNGGCVDPKTTLGYGLTHIVTNHMIVATKDGAVGKHRLLTVGVCGYPHLMELQGGYEDEYVKTSDGWKFKSRIHVFKAAPSLQFGVCANREQP